MYACMLTRLVETGALTAEGAGVTAGGMRPATVAAVPLTGTALALPALAAGAGAGAVLLLPPRRLFATPAGSAAPTGAGAGGGMGYGDATGMPMRARSGCAVEELEDPFTSCGVMTATICADTHFRLSNPPSMMRCIFTLAPSR